MAMMGSRRLDIIINYMAHHRGLLTYVREELKSLRSSYGQLRRRTAEWTSAFPDTATAVQYLHGAFRELYAMTGATADNQFRILNRAMKNYERDVEKGTVKTRGFTKGLQASGFRLGWFGFRLVSMGRLIIRSIIQPTRILLKQLTSWEQGMDTLGMTLGLVEAGIDVTGMSAEDLRKTMMELPQAGMEVQAAMGGVQAALLQLAIDNAPTLISILKMLREILLGVGGAFITSLLRGLENVLIVMTPFLQAMSPLIKFLGRVLAALAPLAPLFIALGTAIFFAGPLLSMLPVLLNPVGIAIMAVVAAITILMAYWKEFVQAIGAIWRAITGGGRRAGGGRVGAQEVNITQNIDVGSIEGEIDLGRVGDHVADSTSEVVRRGQW